LPTEFNVFGPEENLMGKSSSDCKKSACMFCSNLLARAKFTGALGTRNNKLQDNLNAQVEYRDETQILYESLISHKLTDYLGPHSDMGYNYTLRIYL
jgi:hypothetical protein